MNKYWFRPKSYGCGFYPISWEGWMAIFVMLLLIVLSGLINGIFEEGTTAKQEIRFILDMFFIASISTLFFERKMKEPFQWRWGRKK